MSAPDVLAVAPLPAPVRATVALPGSKSLTNRALVCAALATGTSRLDGVLDADDTRAMVGCLRALGAELTWDRDGASITLAGWGGRVPAGDGVVLDVASSGTTARFLLPLLLAGEGRYVVDASAQMRARPMADTVRALRALGAEVAATGDGLPVTVAPGAGVAGRGAVRVGGDVSSQFLSGLLLAGPCLGRADRPLTVEVTTSLVSRPYVDMTAAVMRAFGADVAEPMPGTFTVAPTGYRAARYAIEPDASAASYAFALAALTGSTITVEGLGAGSVQGDVRFVDVLEAMGADVTRAPDAITVRGTGLLRGVEVDLADCSDTAPTFAVVAGFADGPSRATGIGFIRAKESDRIGAVVTELRRCGVDADEEADGFVVRPEASRRHGARVATYGDHRLAMAFALVGLRVAGVQIEDPGCVAKTFPGYWSMLDALRAGAAPTPPSGASH
jgi:3-phosphoshikimate 1-carboxyvinyltransferase